MRKLKRWIKIPLGISMTSTLFGLVIPTVIIDLFKSKPILTTIWWVITIVWKGILNFLNFNLKVWWVITGVVALFLGLYIYIKVDDFFNADKNKASFLKYTQDTIFGWKWSWTWEKQYDGKYHIEHLHPICSVCDTPLVSTDLYGSITCPRCKKRLFSECPNFDTIKVMITDNVKKGLTPQK
jgi:hypothetical protein